MEIFFESKSYDIYLSRLYKVQRTHNVTYVEIKFFNINEAQLILNNKSFNALYLCFFIHKDYASKKDFDRDIIVTPMTLPIASIMTQAIRELCLATMLLYYKHIVIEIYM